MVEINIIVLVQSLLAFISAYIIVTLSLNLEAGYTGIPNFGKALFVAAGAFVAVSIGNRLSALLIAKLYEDELNELIQQLRLQSIITDVNALPSMYMDPTGNRHVDRLMDAFFANHPILGVLMFIMILILAVVIGGILGYLISYPALRLRGEYLAILLLAAAEMVVMSIGYYWVPLSGGTTGFFMPKYLAVFGTNIRLVMTGIMTFFAILMYLYAQKIGNSPAGRMLRAVRDDELAAASLGKDIAKVRRDIIIISSAMAALAGALWAIYTESVVARHYQRFPWTFIPWAMMIVGGVANNSGVVVGVSAIMVLQRFIDIIKGQLGGILPFDPTWLYQIGLGILIIVMLYVRPQGLIPERPSKTVEFEKMFNEVLEENVKDDRAKKLIREGRATP